MDIVFLTLRQPHAGWIGKSRNALFDVADFSGEVTERGEVQAQHRLRDV